MKTHLLALSLVIAAAGCTEVIEAPETDDSVGYSDTYTCYVYAKNINWKNMGKREVTSFDACHDYAFRIGDRYCDRLREGEDGPNPIVLGYGMDTEDGWLEDTWEFGCAVD